MGEDLFEERGDRLTVGRIDVDEIERGGEPFEGDTGVERDESRPFLDSQQGDVFLDAGGCLPIAFDEGGVRRAAAQSFKAHRAAAGVQIEKAGSLYLVLADVEDGFS